jgi:hypothetical protein
VTGTDLSTTTHTRRKPHGSSTISRTISHALAPHVHTLRSKHPAHLFPGGPGCTNQPSWCILSSRQATQSDDFDHGGRRNHPRTPQLPTQPIASTQRQNAQAGGGRPASCRNPLQGRGNFTFESADFPAGLRSTSQRRTNATSTWDHELGLRADRRPNGTPANIRATPATVRNHRPHRKTGSVGAN